MGDTVNSVKEVVKEIMPYLEQAAEKLGTTAQYIWALQVKQGYITGAYYAICWIAWVSLICFCVWFITKRIPKADYNKTSLKIFNIESQIKKIRDKKYKAIGSNKFEVFKSLEERKERELSGLKMIKNNEFPTEFVFSIITILIIIFGFFWLPSIKDMLSLIFNPEYWALNEVIHLLKGAVR